MYIDPRTVVSAGSASETPEEKQVRDHKALKKACQDFEAVFLHSMMKSMRKTIPEGGLFKKSNAMNIYEDLMDGELAARMSRQGANGIAEQMYQQLKKYMPK
jgi:flagellar protein FlgJ